MSRLILRRALPLLAVFALCLLAQSSHDNYQNLYKNWREGDPNLELDAADAPADALSSRAEKAAGLAAAYGSAHLAQLKEVAREQSANLQWLGANMIQSLPDLAPAPDEVRFVNRESNAVSASMAAFANDPDKAIQQLRQSYQREQAALEALKTSIIDRQQAEDKAIKAVSSVEASRSKALQEYTFLSSSLTQSADAMNQEVAAWATYYSKLDEAAHATAAPPTAPAVTSTASPSSGSSSSPSTASAAPRPPSVTAVPLSRYVGVWSYRNGSPFFGSQPEVVDVTVHEENGRATGTFYARFKLPPGSPGDPVLRFDFSGEFKPSMKQTFALTTEEGASGSVELNPGVAFNELEINFNTDPKPGKVHQGDMLLLKQ